MPTNANAYNSRLTDEALEKRFRDTFRSQGGAELVDDLYASGVIVPVVDFTQAAEGSQLPTILQTAWDFSTGQTTVSNSSSEIINTAGFWQIDLSLVGFAANTQSPNATVTLSDGLSSKTVWKAQAAPNSETIGGIALDEKFVVFVRANDTVSVATSIDRMTLSVWYRQIATVSGDLINPTGFTSS